MKQIISFLIKVHLMLQSKLVYNPTFYKDLFFTEINFYSFVMYP